MSRIIVALVLVIMSCPVFAAELQVIVMGIDSERNGQICLAVWKRESSGWDGQKWDGKHWDPSKRVVGDCEKAQADRLTFRLDLPPGCYAASALHDENENQSYDSGLFGLGGEEFSFMKDPHPGWQPPNFADIEFKLTEEGYQGTIELEY